MVVRLTAFKSDGNSSRFNNATESTYNILNATLTTDLEFLFNISGLKDHTIESITFDSLFSLNGNYKFELKKDNDNFGTVTKEIKSIKFATLFSGNGSSEASDSVVLTYKITNNNTSECDYGLNGFTITLSDTLLDYKVSFSGPLLNRTVGEIDCSVIVLNKGTEAISFTKDPVNKFSSETDIIPGRVYFKNDGIFVDGYQYGVNASATTSNFGIVKLSDNSFEIDLDGGLIAPSDIGIAATPLLVYNTLATAKLYIDDSIGVLVPTIEADDGELIAQTDGITFSNDFTKKDNKLYINWLELI